jgi:hypothetical protein
MRLETVTAAVGVQPIAGAETTGDKSSIGHETDI